MSKSGQLNESKRAIKREKQKRDTKKHKSTNWSVCSNPHKEVFSSRVYRGHIITLINFKV